MAGDPPSTARRRHTSSPSRSTERAMCSRAPNRPERFFGSVPRARHSCCSTPFQEIHSLRVNEGHHLRHCRERTTGGGEVRPPERSFLNDARSAGGHGLHGNHRDLDRRVGRRGYVGAAIAPRGHATRKARSTALRPTASGTSIWESSEDSPYDFASTATESCRRHG